MPTSKLVVVFAITAILLGVGTYLVSNLDVAYATTGNTEMEEVKPKVNFTEVRFVNAGLGNGTAEVTFSAENLTSADAVIHVLCFNAAGEMISDAESEEILEGGVTASYVFEILDPDEEIVTVSMAYAIQ